MIVLICFFVIVFGCKIIGMVVGLFKLRIVDFILICVVLLLMILVIFFCRLWNIWFVVVGFGFFDVFVFGLISGIFESLIIFSVFLLFGIWNVVVDNFFVIIEGKVFFLILNIKVSGLG